MQDIVATFEMSYINVSAHQYMQTYIDACMHCGTYTVGPFCV